MKATFNGGVNIALKIPRHKYEETVKFYRETLGFAVEERKIDNPTVSRTHRFQFGPNTLWLDCVDNYTHTETWLELKTDDMENAAEYLKSKGIEPRDELEEIPDNMHWIMDPAGTVFIMTQ